MGAPIWIDYQFSGAVIFAQLEPCPVQPKIRKVVANFSCILAAKDDK